MNDLPANYDAYRTGPFGRFERDQERKGEAYTEALSTRDLELREDPNELAEAFGENVDVIQGRWEEILLAAARNQPPREVGEALTRLVNDVIDADAKYYAEEKTR